MRRGCGWGALWLVLAVLLGGCGRDWEVATRIDRDWYRRNLEEAHLAHWLVAAPTGTGFFNTALDRHWRPMAEQPGDLVAQARTVYVMAVGHEVTGQPAYLEQVRQGTDFLLRHYRDPIHGGWFEAVAPDGTVRNGNKRLYAQAFALFALAHAYRVTREERYLQAALDGWREIGERFGEPGGGFRAGMTRDFAQTLLGHEQNPLMHLFEALLALDEAGGGDAARSGASGLGDFVAYKLLQGAPDGGAYLPETYDASWKPLAAGQGGRIDVGHQFEWAYLFSAAAEQGLNPIYAGVAERLLKYAMGQGYDPDQGGVFSVVSTHDRRKGSWQQAEALRSLMHHAVVRGRDDLWAPVTQMTEFIRSELVDEENGGWRPAPLSTCRRGGCPDRQPDGYHMVALHREALRLVQRTGRR